MKSIAYFEASLGACGAKQEHLLTIALVKVGNQS